MRQSAPFTLPLSRSLGQFFTPPAVVDLAFNIMCWLAPDITKGTLLDLSCGEGAFLAGALRAGFAIEQLYGLDADPRLPGVWAEAGLAGHLAVADGLLGARVPLFDAVVGNPPFAGRPPTDQAEYLAANSRWLVRNLQSNHVSLPRDMWFLERSLGLLKPEGLLAMVLPEGIFANHRWKRQRTDLFAENRVEAIIGLPRSLFRASRTTVKTCLLVLARQIPEPNHHVRLAEIEREEELSEIERLLTLWEQGQSHWQGQPWTMLSSTRRVR